MKKRQLYLILGCFGRRDDDFVSCAGIENSILSIESDLYHYEDMMNYFDMCRLFDRPIFDYNAIRHFLFNVQDRYDQPTRRLWSQKKFELYQKFTLDHKCCGLCVKLALLSNDVSSEEKSILITAEDSQQEFLKDQSPLRLIRGR